MLVNRKTGTEDGRALVPTRVVTTLPLELKTHHLFEAASSEDIVKRAVYSLDVFDNATRLHLTVGPFVSPEASKEPKVHTLHYIRLDMSVNRNSNYVFMVEGCQKVPAHLSHLSCLVFSL